MSSIHNIPEPTTAYRPVVDEPAPPPTVIASTRRPDCAEKADTTRPVTEIDEEVGAMTWLVVLVISGLFSRAALWFFGPWQGVAEGATRWGQLGRSILESGPGSVDGAMPAVPLLAYGLESVGVPLWALSGLQALIGVVAIAAGYHLANKLTGRCLAGVCVAALLALHPGVLTWTTAVSPGGFACGLVVIGLYLLVRTPKDEPTNPWPAAAVLGIAAITSPVAWLAGLGAALWVLWADRGRRGVVSAGIVLALTLGPALGWSAISGGNLAPRWVGSASSAPAELPSATQLAAPSLEELGTQLRFNMQPNGALAQATSGRADLPAHPDRVADVIGESWVALNTALLLACAVGLGLMLRRGRIAAAACVAVPVLALLATGMPLDEPGRVALFGPLALLAFGWLSTPAVPALTPEEKEARQHEKELQHQQKLEARRLKHEQKHGLYAFDKPRLPGPASVATAVTEPPAPAPPPEPAPADEPPTPAEEDPPPPAMMRPI